MPLDLVFQALGLVTTVFFLPLPVFWLVLHRNIAYFRRHKSHALYLKLALLAVSVVFASYNFPEVTKTVNLDIILRATGIALLAGSAYLTYKTLKLLGKGALIGVDELKNKKRLVDRDIYRFIRHPRYLDVFVFILGVFLLTGVVAVAYLFVYSIAMFHLVAIEEERELGKRLGSKYRAYRKRTGRFLPKSVFKASK